MLKADSNAPRDGLEQFLADICVKVLRVEEVDIHDNLFSSGMNSRSAYTILKELKLELGEIVYITALYDAPTIANLAIYLKEHYPDAISRRFAIPTTGNKEIGRGSVNEDKVAKFRGILNLLSELMEPIRQRGTTGQSSLPKNPPAVFILSPPRSGSTLLRVMLGGHPLLFSPPELNLLSFANLKDRKTALIGRQSFWGEGTLRAIMEIEGCSGEKSEAIMREYEDRHLTTRQFYYLLQEKLGDKMLVDKTPPYTFEPQVLRRAEQYFESPFYIHLTRHPCGMISSFEEARLNLLYNFGPQYPARELAEIMWVISHQNIIEFLKTIPAERQYWIKFEELLGAPMQVMDAISKFLRLEFHPDMLKPYEEKKTRMTNGTHDYSLVLGDQKFHNYSDIESRAAEKWKTKYDERSLGEVTRSLANSLGYYGDNEGRTGSSLTEQSSQQGYQQSLLLQIQDRAGKRKEAIGRQRQFYEGRRRADP